MGRTATFYQEFSWKLENENQRFFSISSRLCIFSFLFPPADIYFPSQSGLLSLINTWPSLFSKHMARYFSGRPVVKISPPNAGGVGSIPAPGDKLLYAPQAKTKNRSNIVTNSIKTLKVIHIQKILKKNKRPYKPQHIPFTWCEELTH